jgi:hypothetical protein
MKAYMKTIWQGIAVVLAVALFGCSADGPRKQITDGLYLESSKAESVSVSGDQISFKIFVENGERSGVFDRTYDCTLDRDGEIRVHGSSNDPVLVFGVLRYHWFWNGATIVRRDRGTDRDVEFTRSQV